MPSDFSKPPSTSGPQRNGNLYLPATVRQLANSVGTGEQNVALRLDKYSYAVDQQHQKEVLDTVCRIPGPRLYSDLLNRWRDALKTLYGFRAFQCRTIAPLTLHLSRASALENAGICLHPIYGFVYLPGSGLKGMARAYAETVWLRTQANQEEAWRLIEDVFGWAPNPERRQQIQDPNHPAQERLAVPGDQKTVISASCGAIVFHDAWPLEWPRLQVDIVNNHHPKYYQAPPDDDGNPPGDWENPQPVYFLCIKRGCTFLFALSKRREEIPDHLLDLAQQWLVGALCHFGAGAKTNAGYGAFELCQDLDATTQESVKRTWQEATASNKALRLECRVEVELITPGFFAGAEQFGPEAQKGCDLRSATLRGLLRWWWRTLHAGFVSVSILRRLEAAIWGDTECGGAVQIIVRPLGDPVVEAYDKRNKANFDNSQKRSNYGIPNSDPTKTTQGLWYLSYGMDEQIRGQHRRRNYLAPGMRWAIVFRIRRAIWQPPLRNKKPEEKVIISPQQVLNQALAALWLLCHFGGVGAKSRKGFGSLQIVVSPEEWSLEKCKQVGRDLRQHLGLGNQFSEGYYHSPSIEKLIAPFEVTFTWPDIWLVLDQIGFAYQAFAKRYAHNLEKRALGLPRRIGQPLKGSFELRKPVKDTNRHASPVCIHVAKQGDKYIIRVVAFPAPYLPDLSQSTKFLGEFMKYVEAELKKRSSLSLPQVSSRSSGPASSSSSSSSSPTSPYRTGQEVKAVLLAERTKKGGWKARIVGSSLEGPIVNSNEVPADKKPGEEIAVVIQSISGREAMFRYVPSSPESKRS